MDKLLEYSPARISFDIRLGKQSTSNLQLHNIADVDIAYKVKTTQLKRYCVRPNAAILRAGERIQVELVQQACKTMPKDIDDCKDKFLLQVVRLDALEVSCPTVQDVWRNAISSTIVKVKFTVQMQIAYDEQSPPPSNTKSTQPAIPASLPAELNPRDVASPTDEATEMPPTPPALPHSPLAITPPLELNLSVTEIPDVQLVPDASPPSPASDAKADQTQTITPQTISNTSPPKSNTTPSVDEITPVDPMLTTEPTSSHKPSMKSEPVISAPETQPTETELVAESSTKADVDYKSVEYTRDRVLNIRTAPKISLPSPERSEKQRIAVERAGELVRNINIRQAHIDSLRKDLTEAKHKLSDAQIAVQPAHDVRYEVNESARVPFAQICLMAVISGALLQFLV